MFEENSGKKAFLAFILFFLSAVIIPLITALGANFNYYATRLLKGFSKTMVGFSLFKSEFGIILVVLIAFFALWYFQRKEHKKLEEEMDFFHAQHRCKNSGHSEDIFVQKTRKVDEVKNYQNQANARKQRDSYVTRTGNPYNRLPSHTYYDLTRGTKR